MQACKHNDVACCQNYTAFVRQNPCPTICNMFPFFTLILHHSSDTTHLTHLTTLSETHLPATPPPPPKFILLCCSHFTLYNPVSLPDFSVKWGQLCCSSLPVCLSCYKIASPIFFSFFTLNLFSPS